MITVLFILCFNCLQQSVVLLCFLCLSPDVVFRGDTKWLFVLRKMWTEESLLSKGHILLNTKAEGLQNDIGGFVGFRLKRTIEENFR